MDLAFFLGSFVALSKFCLCLQENLLCCVKRCGCVVYWICQHVFSTAHTAMRTAQFLPSVPLWCGSQYKHGNGNGRAWTLKPVHCRFCSFRISIFTLETCCEIIYSNDIATIVVEMSLFQVCIIDSSTLTGFTLFFYLKGDVKMVTLNFTPLALSW